MGERTKKTPPRDMRDLRYVKQFFDPTSMQFRTYIVTMDIFDTIDGLVEELFNYDNS